MKKILNLTQHVATEEQLKAGVIEPNSRDKKYIQGWLTFKTLPTKSEIYERAYWLATTANGYGCDAALIGGATYLMSALEENLRFWGIKPLHAFSKREVQETRQPDESVAKTDQAFLLFQPDESVVKTSTFRHLGFVEV